MEVPSKLCEKEKATKLCEPCAVENVSNQADGFCKDCDEFMCQRCFRDHLKGKSCRNHVLDTISGAPFQRKLQAQEEKCKIHTSEPVKYYCSLHDFIGCGDCIVSNHGKCEPKFIRDLAINLVESSMFKSLISQVQKSDVDKVESETRISRYRKENDTLAAKAIREIKEFRRDIDCWLDKMETNIKAEIKIISDGNEQTFSELKQMIVEISDDIKRINPLLDSNIHHGENLFIRMIECKPEVKVIDKTLSKIKSKLIFQKYTFEQGEEIKGMLMSSEKLGSIKVIAMTECGQSTEDFNMPPFATESEPENGCSGPTSKVQDFEYPLRAELEMELEKTRKLAIFEKEEKEHLQQEYNKLKKELEAQEAMLTRERENAAVKTTEKDQSIFLLKQEKGSLNDLNISLNSQLNSRNKEFALLESKSIARHDQDHNIIDTLQSELKKTRDDNKSLSRQIFDLQIQRESANTNLLDLQQQRQSAMYGISDLNAQLKQKDERILLLKLEVSSLNDLNTSLKSQLDRRNNEFNVLESTSKIRQEQDNNTIKSLQSDITKLGENHEKECNSLSREIEYLHRVMKTVRKHFSPDPRAAGLNVGERVSRVGLGFTGIVTDVDPSGYVTVKWDNGGSWSCAAGAEGEYNVKLL